MITMIAAVDDHYYIAVDVSDQQIGCLDLTKSVI